MTNKATDEYIEVYNKADNLSTRQHLESIQKLAKQD